MTDRGDRKDHGDRSKKSSNHKENRPFRHPDDIEKWCEIHHTLEHNLKECKTFLDRKKMPPPTALTPQDACQGIHHRANPHNDDQQMGEINVIFRASMSITSKTQDKKLKREISLTQ
jgi:hypothetical protein